MELQQMLQNTQQPNKQPPNQTGIPDPVKHDFESRSGLSFDDVRVHYHSKKPAQFHALAYTQGADVYIGPGQERHLAHELGHVVQQKQGRVAPTGTWNGFAFNTSRELEQEADTGSFSHIPVTAAGPAAHSSHAPIQRVIDIYHDKAGWHAQNNGRPEFTNTVNHFFHTAAHSGQSINHIISSSDISKTLAACLSLELQISDLPPADYDPSVNEHQERASNMRRLVKAVLPKKPDLVFIDNNSSDPKRLEDFEKQAAAQREEALQLENMLFQYIQNGNSQYQIEIPYVASLAGRLESVMHNSFGNLRIGNSTVNKRISNHIDPILHTYESFQPENSNTPAHIIFNGDILSEDESEESAKTSSMAKRMHKLAKLETHLIASGADKTIHMPRVISGTTGNVQSSHVLSSDVDKDTQYPKKADSMPGSFTILHKKSVGNSSGTLSVWHMNTASDGQITPVTNGNDITPLEKRETLYNKLISVFNFYKFITYSNMKISAVYKICGLIYSSNLSLPSTI